MKTPFTILLILAVALVASGCTTPTRGASKLLALQERLDKAGVTDLEVNVNAGSVDYEVVRTETERTGTLEINSVASPRLFLRTQKPIIVPSD